MNMMIEEKKVTNIRLLIPFYGFWLIVILPKSLQLIALVLIIAMLINKRANKGNIISLILLSYIIIYISSSIINAIAFEHEFERLLAGLNTIAIWIIALIYFQVFLNNVLPIEKLKKIIFFNFFVLFCLYICTFIMHNLMGMAEFKFMGNLLFSSSWYEGAEEIRFRGFLEYPNLVPLLSMMFVPFIFNYFSKAKFPYVKTLCLSVCILVMVNASLSRSGLVAICIGFLLFILNFFANKNIKVFIIVVSFLLALALSVLYFFNGFGAIQDAFSQLATAREGSNMTRGNIYQSSIKRAFEYSPLVGMGIKDVSPYDNLPYGSHSTYIGFFYKTGFIGFFIGLVLFVFINLKVYLQSKLYFTNNTIRLFVYMFFAISLMITFEDIDGSNWLLVFYFSILGIILNKENWRSLNENLFSDV
ncbi:O-antigen ligase family protein [Priestia megaterium]|uniref:O-antigen ligase family protein n=1 Tax=Priestia megaterium TaxID=1404 RepID=UPI0030C9BCD6